MAKTFLELTNDAISEAKATLDPLTTANFANPPRTILYNMFKKWINRAYRELMLTRNEWEFRMERANLIVWPRLHLTDLSYIPAIGDVIQGNVSGASAVIVKVHSYEDVEGDSIIERTVSVNMVGTDNIYDFHLNESIDRTSPTLGAAVAKVKGAGSYNIRDEILNMQQIDISSIRIMSTDSPTEGPRPLLRVVEWGNWLEGEYPWINATGRPEFVTQTADGNLEFHPKLDRDYLMSFTFARKLPELVNATDIPSQVPEQFEDYIMWKAVADFADYDSNQRLFSRANKNLEKYMYWMERDETETPHFGYNRFYR